MGDYEQTIKGNLLGIEADKRYFEYREKMGYPNMCFFLIYKCHNIHFLAHASMFAAQYQPSLYAGKEILKVLTKETLEDKSFFTPSGAYWLEGFASVILHVHIRFGKW
jgi:hypothetical protein